MQDSSSQDLCEPLGGTCQIYPRVRSGGVGEGGWEAAEKLQREVGKLILGDPTRTANEVVLGGLGLVGTQSVPGQS